MAISKRALKEALKTNAAALNVVAAVTFIEWCGFVTETEEYPHVVLSLYKFTRDRDFWAQLSWDAFDKYPAESDEEFIEQVVEGALIDIANSLPYHEAVDLLTCMVKWKVRGFIPKGHTHNDEPKQAEEPRLKAVS